MYCRHLSDSELRNLACNDPLSAAGEVVRRFVNGELVSKCEIDDAIGEATEEVEALRDEFDRVLLNIQRAANGV